MLVAELSGSNLDIPEELLQVLPSDPFEQLDVARKITSIALSTRVNTLQSEVSALRDELVKKDELIAELEAQGEPLHAALSEAADKLALAEQDKVWTLEPLSKLNPVQFAWNFYLVLLFSQILICFGWDCEIVIGEVVEGECFTF